MYRCDRTALCLAVAGLAASATSALAQSQCGSEDAKVSPATGAAGDNFGHSLDVSSAGFGVVGAPDAGDEGTGAGRAYLYDFNPVAPLFLFELAAADGLEGIEFGEAVALSDGFAIVGAPSESSLGPGSGAAYLFQRSTGVQVDKLLASDGRGRDLFGIAVDIDRELIVVGATDKASSSGAAYVFEIVGTDAIERAKLAPADIAAVDRFGSAIAIDGGGPGAGEVAHALISSPLNDDSGASSGSVYLFNLETGAEMAKLVADDASAGARFGYSVELLIEDAVALAAIAADTDNPDGSTGSVYLFDVSDPTNPVQLSKITPSDPVTAGDFGASIALTADTLLVGALSGETTRAGTAYGFDISDPANPVQTAIIRPSEPVPFALFGSSAAAFQSGDSIRLFVGAPADDAGDPIAGEVDVGAVHALSVGACQPDIDGDCLLTIFDFLGFQNLFDAGDPRADFDGDGGLTLFDFLAYQNAFDAGC